MASSFKLQMSNNNSDEKKTSIQRLDAIKSLTEKLKKSSEDWNFVKSEIESIKDGFDLCKKEVSKIQESSKLLENEINAKFCFLEEKVNTNNDDIVESIESYIVSDNFTPRSNMSEITDRLVQLEDKLNSLLNPVRSHSVSREAKDTDTKISFSKLKLNKQ